MVFSEAIGSVKLGKSNERDVARCVRQVVAINLTALRKVLEHMWAFSILADGATHCANGYLGVRLSFELEGAIHNVHLLSIPMGGKVHTASNYADLVRDLPNSVGGNGILSKLISATSDGAVIMLGCRQRFAMRIRDACAALGGTGVTVNWCGGHQLNLAVDASLK